MRKEPISRIMTKDVIILTLDDSLFNAEKLFKKHHIRHIPVVGNNRIIGMLSLTSLLHISFVDSYNDEQSIDTAICYMLPVIANNPKRHPQVQ